MNVDRLNEKIREKVRHCEYAEARELVKTWWELFLSTKDMIGLQYPNLDWGHRPLLSIWFQKQGLDGLVLDSLVFWFTRIQGWERPIGVVEKSYFSPFLPLSGVCVMGIDSYASPGPKFPPLPTMDELFLVSTERWQEKPDDAGRQAKEMVERYRATFGS